MRLKIRVVTLILVGGAFIYVLIDNGSLGSILTLLGALTGLVSTYIGEDQGEIGIDLRRGTPPAFIVRNTGNTELREVKIKGSPELSALQRDFDDIPATLEPQHVCPPIPVGLELGKSHQFVFQVSWHCGLQTKKSRKITVRLE